MKKALFFILVILAAALTLSKIARADESVDIEIDYNDPHGKLNQSLGITLPSNNLATYTTNLLTYFKDKNFYIRLVSPQSSVFDTPEFTQLTNNGFKWYLSVNSLNEVESMLAKYFLKTDKEVVVELRTHANFNAQRIKDLKAQFPKARFHSSHFVFWPREQVKEVFSQVQSPNLEAVSFTTQEDTNVELFDDIKLMFATLYDASMDISGGSVKINYPANATLSLADIRTASQADQEIARRAGIISGAIISSVQSQNLSGKAPLRYVIAGKIIEINEKELTLLSHFATFSKLNPDIVWPYAIKENGDPWDNDFFDKSNTKPVVGVGGKVGDKLYMFFSNTSTKNTTIEINGNYNLSDYKVYSTTTGDIASINNKTYSLRSYETIVLYHPTNYQPPQPPQATQTPTPTTTPGNNPTLTPIATAGPTITQAETRCHEGNTQDFNLAVRLGKIKDVDFFNNLSGLYLNISSTELNCRSTLPKIPVTPLSTNPDNRIYKLTTPLKLRPGTYSIIFDADPSRVRINPVRVANIIIGTQGQDCTNLPNNNCGGLNEIIGDLLLSGDANNDAKINILDYELYRKAVNARYNPVFDFDFNNKVDFIKNGDDDLQILINNFGRNVLPG